MSTQIRKTARLICLLQQHPRITIRRLQEELCLSRSQVYRNIKAVSDAIPVRIQGGVVFTSTEDLPQ